MPKTKLTFDENGCIYPYDIIEVNIDTLKTVFVDAFPYSTTRKYRTRSAYHELHGSKPTFNIGHTFRRRRPHPDGFYRVAKFENDEVTLETLRRYVNRRQTHNTTNSHILSVLVLRFSLKIGK